VWHLFVHLQEAQAVRQLTPVWCCYCLYTSVSVPVGFGYAMLARLLCLREASAHLGRVVVCFLLACSIALL
jgi:hypothetical protein